jgi:hypothetical protein
MTMRILKLNIKLEKNLEILNRDYTVQNYFLLT